MKGHDEAIIKIKDGKYLRIYYRNTMFHLPFQLPEKVKNNTTNPYFDFEKGKLKKGYGKDYDTANTIITARLSKINTIIAEAKLKNEDALLKIKDYFNRKSVALKERVVTENSLLIETFTNWCIDKNSENLKAKENSELSDLQKAIIANLNHYQKNQQPFKLIDIDMKWMKDFAKWCVEPKERTQQVYRSFDNVTYTTTRTVQVSNSTLRRHLIDFVAFFKDLQILHPFLKFPIKPLQKFAYDLPTRYEKKKMKEEWAYDYLSEKEWGIVKNHKIDDGRRIEWSVCLDLYRFCVYTGLRYTDMCELNRLDIQNNQIHLEAKKTARKVKRGTVTVPLNNHAIEILDKYMSKDKPDEEPIFGKVAPTNQRANKMLRRIFEEIPELHEKKRVRNFYLNVIKDEYKRKCDIISWHSSRRTFVNLMVKRGATIQQLQTYTGWVDIKTLINYMSALKKDDDDSGFDLVNSF